MIGSTDKGESGRVHWGTWRMLDKAVRAEIYGCACSKFCGFLLNALVWTYSPQ